MKQLNRANNELKSIFLFVVIFIFPLVGHSQVERVIDNIEYESRSEESFKIHYQHKDEASQIRYNLYKEVYDKYHSYMPSVTEHQIVVPLNEPIKGSTLVLIKFDDDQTLEVEPHRFKGGASNDRYSIYLDDIHIEKLKHNNIKKVRIYNQNDETYLDFDLTVLDYNIIREKVKIIDADTYYIVKDKVIDNTKAFDDF
jgi:hypothetical protein